MKTTETLEQTCFWLETSQATLNADVLKALAQILAYQPNIDAYPQIRNHIKEMRNLVEKMQDLATGCDYLAQQITNTLEELERENEK